MNAETKNYQILSHKAKQLFDKLKSNEKVKVSTFIQKCLKHFPNQTKDCISVEACCADHLFSFYHKSNPQTLRIVVSL